MNFNLLVYEFIINIIVVVWICILYDTNHIDVNLYIIRVN